MSDSPQTRPMHNRVSKHWVSFLIKPLPPVWDKPASHLDQKSDHKFRPILDLTFGQHYAPKFDPKRDLILIKIQTPSSIPNSIPFRSKFWPRFDTTWDLVLIKILTPVLWSSRIQFRNNVGRMTDAAVAANRRFAADIFLNPCNLWDVVLTFGEIV